MYHDCTVSTHVRCGTFAVHPLGYNIIYNYVHESCTEAKTRTKSKGGAVVKHQRTFVVLKTTSNVKGLLQSGAAPLRSTVL